MQRLRQGKRNINWLVAAFLLFPVSIVRLMASLPTGELTQEIVLCLQQQTCYVKSNRGWQCMYNDAQGLEMNLDKLLGVKYRGVQTETLLKLQNGCWPWIYSSTVNLVKSCASVKGQIDLR